MTRNQYMPWPLCAQELRALPLWKRRKHGVRGAADEIDRPSRSAT